MLFGEKSSGKIKGLLNTGCDVLIRANMRKRRRAVHVLAPRDIMIAVEKGVICTCNVTTRKSLFEQTLENN